MSEAPITKEQLSALMADVARQAAKAAEEGCRQGYEAELPKQFARVAAAARAAALEEAAKACEQMDADYGRHANLVVAAAKIRSLANPAERTEGEKT